MIGGSCEYDHDDYNVIGTQVTAMRDGLDEKSSCRPQMRGVLEGFWLARGP